MKRQEHWDRVYSTKSSSEVSWFQAEPTLSLRLIAACCDTGASVIDVGGGASLLVDRLLARGFSRLTVLDISGAAIESAKRRLGDKASTVHWIEADITAAPDLGRLDVWHDRAVFHFLTDSADRQKYIDTAARTVVPGGTVIMATFAPNGPERCSGLDVQRWEGRSLAREFGDRFELLEELTETHMTPQGKGQEFVYARFRRSR